MSEYYEFNGKKYYYKDNPFAFFKYLQMCKRGTGYQLLSEINTKNVCHIKELQYYEVMCFKTYICELIYNAINLFPDISEYTIICKNEIGIAHVNLGLFETIADDGEPCMAKFNFKSFEEEDDEVKYDLELAEIKDLYCNNRHQDVRPDIINTLMVLLYMGGHLPTVVTSYKINPESLKNRLKFK